ncbi:MAG: outer membrane beta-barrel domain-containing protein [Alteromonadaceae bacterium]|nr:MAG: outer membrane beta-barrel domain-containing protein [Alteromonadaceae bacterium]
MENRFQRIFLTFVCLICATGVHAQDDENTDEQTILDAVIKPDIERRKVNESKIDSENFEIGVYAGVLSVEDFGSNNVNGIRVAYHISEDWFIESTFGQSEIGETSFEALSGTKLLTEEERQLEYFNVSLGVNLFPGEIFLGRNYAFNSSYYLVFGAGNTRFADDEFFTFNFGGGFRLFVTDWLAFRTDFRNHVMTHNIFGEDKSIQNLETHVGLSIFF